MGTFSFEEAAPGKNTFSFEDATKPAKTADAKIGQPEDLTFAEKYIAPALEAIGLGDQSAAGKLGFSRGGWTGRLAQGAADFSSGPIQLVANAMGQGEDMNKFLADHEQRYQEARKVAGSTGYDPMRVAGNIGMTAFASAATPWTLPEKLGTYGKAAIQGAGYGAMQPVTDGGENYWTDKAKEAAIGLLAGPAGQLAGRGIARVISPNASVNPEVQMLRDAGVRPTVGQTLGGWANTLEEKAMSVPIMGDAIASARRGAVKDFNNAVLNTATGPIGQKVEGAGFDAVGSVGDKLRGAYNKAADDVGSVNINNGAFNDSLKTVMDKAGSLTGDMRDRFNNVLKDEVLRRMGPDGTIHGGNIKTIDAELGRIAAEWKASSAASEKELGSVVRDLQQAVRSGVAAESPTYDAARSAADQGWRVFRLARNAAAAAQNKEGIFTPAQFNTAIRSDAGKAAVGEGNAFMQDVGQAAQNVLGNKYPDSGSVGRGLLAAGALGAGAVHMGVPVATLAGAAAYTSPVQNALRALVASRPKDAPRLANRLRALIEMGGTQVAVPLAESMRR